MDLLRWILRLYFLFHYHSILISSLGNDTDRLSLLAFKEGISQDPQQVVSSWNDSAHFCKWVGVTCSLRQHQRVVGIDLGNHKLVVTISPSVGNLSFLEKIDLSSNHFSGNIPQEFGGLSCLQQLDLSINSLGGEIPNNLSKCLNLTSLSLYQNSLTGSIPFQLSSLKKLQVLYLDSNNLTGTVPPWIGNFSSLRILFLATNTLYGSIPNELGQLSQLEYISISANMLSGVIPPSLYNLTSIDTFDVVANKLHGTIPPNVGQTLPNLKRFLLAGNGFHGTIPFSLSNASGLSWLEFAGNSFTGPIPMNLGSLRNLTLLHFGSTKIGSGREDDLNFITSLFNCSLLEKLSLYEANLGGVLPESIGNLSINLQLFELWGNLIHGHIPASISNLVSLTTLSFSNNLINGSIPFSIGKLRNLNKLSLSSNKLSGQVPSSLGNLTHLIYLLMGDNGLEGAIPPTLGNLKDLFVFNFSGNKLGGAITKQVFTLSSLVYFDVSNNSLGGSLSLNVGNLVNLVDLGLSFNNFSGEIPNTISSCFKLEYLNMENNLFHGTIPQSFKALKPLQSLRLSHNNLTGEIPEFLIHAPLLQYLDLSYNDLDGEVPKEGIFRNATAISVRDNNKLCGGIKELRLPTCSEEEVERSSHLLPPRTIIFIAFGVLFFILVAISCSVYWLTISKKASAPSTSSALEKWKSGASYMEIFRSTNGFSLECLIGVGSFGSVYKGLLSDEETYVAIKVLNLQQKGASMSFIAECEALKNMRHRNLIKVVTVCSSIDFQGNDLKALVFEFMPNGSLEQWLHSIHMNDQQQPRVLSFVQRVNIAIDVAFGLEYLHHSYGETIVHCDIKPSNVLLDTDMVAHVGDFGLARFLFNTVDDQEEALTLSSGLKGSIGYIPQEYGVGGEVSTAGDMYSYGILLLEMFTGKKPTDEMFKEGLSLYEFVASAMPDRVVEIVDVSLFSETLEEGEDENGELGNVNESEEAPALSRRTTEWKKGECLVSILAIALSCCAPSPKDRAVAGDIVKKMISIRDLFMCMP